MARPKLPERTSINVYLTREQKDYLVKKAHLENKSPSAVVRGVIDWMRNEPNIRDHDDWIDNVVDPPR